MERKINFSVYVGAFVLSLLIFVIGIYIGYLIDSSNLQSINQEVSTMSEKMASIQLLLLLEGNSSSCPIYLSELNSLDQEIEKVGYKLSYFEDEKSIYDNDLKRKYFVLEGESYLLSKKVRSVCGDKSLLLVHFYSNKNCSNCKEQGSEILKARDDAVSKGINIRLFSFDGELESPVAEALEAQYGIKHYPSIVVNENTYNGYHNANEVTKIIMASK